jgi:hypothetical protein
MDSLTQEERQVLDHARRYTLTTPEALARRFFPERATAEAVIERLQDRGSLTPAYPLYADRVYFQLTDRACAEFYRRDETWRPLSRGALAKAYAILAFCCLGNDYRERLLKTECQRQFPGLYRHHFPYPDYFLTQAGKDTAPLGFLSVDRSREPERQVRRVHELVDRLAQIDGFVGLLQQEILSLTVITATAEKAAKLKAGFARRPLPVVPHIVVIPELTLLCDER